MTIKELRKRTGLSQSEFAKKFHFNKGTVANWEQGFRNTPEYITFMVEQILEKENELKKLKE